jgi:superfamily II DNA or RNA helicase
MEKYAEYTKKLMNLFDGETSKFKNEDEATKLLMLRKQVLHKAEDKMRVLREIITEIGQDRLKYCFVYVPEGYSENEDESILQKMLDTIKEVFPKTTCNTYTGNNNKKERSAILNGFGNGNIDVLLAMKCLDEGVDVPRAEYGIFASSTGNPRQFIQRRGRLLRKHPDKTFAYIYDLIVVPNFQSPHDSTDIFKMERSLVKGELARVAYFADLATNTHSAKEILQELADHYQLNLSELILSINQ